MWSDVPKCVIGRNVTKGVCVYELLFLGIETAGTQFSSAKKSIMRTLDALGSTAPRVTVEVCVWGDTSARTKLDKMIHIEPGGQHWARRERELGLQLSWVHDLKLRRPRGSTTTLATSHSSSTTY